MLALTRRPNERVRIGQDVIVTVQWVDARDEGRVHLVIETPGDTWEVTRGPGEDVRIGRDIVVQVYRIFPDCRVRLAFDAPREVEIARIKEGSPVKKACE